MKIDLLMFLYDGHIVCRHAIFLLILKCKCEEDMTMNRTYLSEWI